MKTTPAQLLIREMVTKGQLRYDPEQGLLLTAKAEGIQLERLVELTPEQVSRIGQEFDPLFETRKRVASLLGKGVSPATLRAMLDEIEGKPKTGGEPNAEDDKSQLLLPGQETEPEPGGNNGFEGHTTPIIEGESGTNGTTDNIPQPVNSGTGQGPQGRGGQRRGRGTE